MDTLTRAWVRAWAQFSFMVSGLKLSDRAEKQYAPKWNLIKRTYEIEECKRKMCDHD